MSISDFIAILDSIKMEPDIFHVMLASNTMFGFDVKADKRTYLTDCSSDKGKGLEVANPNARDFHHVCVDGGLVTYGLADYVGDGKKHGRFDSMLFSDSILLLVEYKMESTTTIDNNKWRRFSDGMNQIADYFLHFRRLLQTKGLVLEDFYPIDNIVPYICMSNIPQMRPRINMQRFKQMEEFRIKTGLKIRYGTTWQI